MLCSFAAAVTAVLFTVPIKAEAAAQNKDQQKCLNAMVKRGRKVSSTQLSDGRTCIKSYVKGKLPQSSTAQSCLTDDLKGKVAKSTAKLVSDAAKRCTGTGVPDFGLLAPTDVADAHIAENVSIFEDAFGADLDTTLAASSASDPKGKCSNGFVNAQRKLEDAMHKEYGTCIKAGLKNSSIVDIGGMANCLDSLNIDAKGRIAKARDKVATSLFAKCPGGDLAGVFPGLVSICSVYGDDTFATGISNCMQARNVCRVCRITNDAHGTQRDCDILDDGLGNGSCPDCGNGVIDSGEGCDDGNQINGDGCTVDCVIEFCGDGVINNNGTEECDDGVNNSDVLPDACRSDCKNAHCGDGVVDTGESCDDGDLDLNDACPDGSAGTCAPAVCGDGLTCSAPDCSSGPGGGAEACDDANTNNNDACIDTCAVAACGDGFVYTGFEDCDDGNTTPGDCCDGICSFEPAGSVCPGSSGECFGPACDGAGTCAAQPINEGGVCDDSNVCSVASSCQSGICTGTSFVIVQEACNWMIVGNSGNQTLLTTGGATISDGPWCGGDGFFGVNSVFGSDIVIVDQDVNGVAMTFNSGVNADAANIITNNASVTGDAGASLPGLAQTIVAAGQVLGKTPAPTFYDTTGTHLKVSECLTAQTSLATAKAQLDALPSTFNFGSTYAGIAGGTTAPTIAAVNVGSLNVFDFTDITGNADVVINLDGGGDPNTVFIMRIAGRIDTSPRWTFNLLNGLTADHLLWYGKGVGASKCNLGIENNGAGTLFCPDTKIEFFLDSIWSGAAFGGGTSQILLGSNVNFTHVKFTGF